MSPSPGTIRDNEPLSLAVRLMTESKFHHLPVVDVSQRIVGIISDRDIISVNGVLGSGNSEKDLLIKDIMVKDVETISPEDTIHIAASFMVDYRFNALPVVEDQELVGIITSTDLLRLFL